MISSSLAKQSDNHFFASVVKQKELIPLYHDIVVWMLKRDLLVTLHLRIRIIATRELKKRASDSRKAALANRAAKLHQKKLAVQERELALRGRDGRKPLHIPSSMNIQRRRSSNKSGGTSSLHGGHHSDIEEFDEFDEREEEDGFAPSSSSKTPSGLTAFMSLSPPKTRGSSSGSVVSGSIAQRRGLVVPAPSSMSRRLSSTESRGTAISELVIREEEVDEDSSFGGRMAMFGDEEPPSATASSHSISAYRDLDEIPYGYGYYDAGDGLLGGEMEPEEEEEEETDYGPTDSSEEEDGSGATLINDPGRATPMQRRWLTAMSDGVEVHIAKRFEQYVFKLPSILGEVLLIAIQIQDKPVLRWQEVRRRNTLPSGDYEEAAAGGFAPLRAVPPDLLAPFVISPSRDTSVCPTFRFTPLSSVYLITQALATRPYAPNPDSLVPWCNQRTLSAHRRSFHP